VDRLRKEGQKVSSLDLRHIHPLPHGLDNIFGRFKKVAVAELNDRGLYGYGQLASLLRGALSVSNIRSITKTDGLSFMIREIIAGIERVKAEA
jgi:2-oxoglutarate ferredoxin oxidoreductase subunit alpha